MATARRLCARAIQVADEYEETFNGQRLLRNAATARGQPRRLGVVGGNASGKSCFLNLLLQMALVDGDAAYRARGNGEQPGLSLLSSRYGDWDAVQAAVRDGDLAVQFNSRPSPDAEGTKHMPTVEGSLAEYYTGQRSRFGRQKTSLLLPVGKNTDTTTQAAFILHDGLEVACLVIPRSAAALDSEIGEVLRSLLVLAQDETEIGELTKSTEFSQQHAQLKHCTGIDVLAEAKASGASLETVLLGLMEQSGNGSLLLPDLQKLASQLKPSAFIGLRQHLGSDLRYVKDVLEQPLHSMVDLCCRDDPPPDKLLTVDVLGMMVEKIEVTVPCEIYGLLQLMDMPGLNDTRPWANYNISKAISASTDLITLINRNLRGDEPVLQTIVYSGFGAKALERNSRSRLIICHNPERHNSGLNAEDLWSEQYEQDMEDNHAASREVLAERLLTVAPPQLSEEEQRAAVERFLDERCHFITVAPANCLSLMLATPQDVFERLQEEDVEMGANVNQIGAHNHLLERTQMAKLQEILGTISSFQKAQHLGLLKDEVDRQHQNLRDIEGTADALTEEQTKKFGPPLKAKQSDPAKLADFVTACNAFQPHRRGQAEGHTMQSVAAALEAKLLGEPLEGWVQDYRTVQMSDERIAAMADQVVALFQGQESATLPTLRRICKSSALAVRYHAVLDIRTHLLPKLSVTQSRLVEERPEELLRPHREAAAGVADVLKQNMDTFSPNEELVEFLKTERVWRLLAGRIESELKRVAENNLLKGEAFEGAMDELLRSRLSEKLAPLSGYDVVKKFARKNDFWAPFRAALISALEAVREQLPELLKQQLRAHVHNELFSDDRLFTSVRSRSHGLARKEMGRDGRAANGAQEQAGDAADSASAPAPAPTPATPAGRRSRAKKTRPLAEQYERQASLWRALYRFVCDAHDIVVGQEAQNAQRRAALLRELEGMQGELEKAIEMYSGRAGYDELRRQMQRSLLHTMLQRKRLAQVLADSPEVSVHAEPLAFEVELVHLPGGGHAVQGGTFVATLGDLALPAGLQEDFDAMDLLCGMLLQQNRLMWRKEHPIPAGPDNALKAGYSCLTGRRLKPESGLKKVRDIVAKQMFEAGEEALASKLERAGLLPSPVGQQQPLAYILDFADGARYAGLLELQELAAACLKEDEAFLVWSTARLDGGRFHAYLLPATPLATSGPAQRTVKAFPIMLFGGMVDGVVRPVFEPLFKAPRELLSLGAPQASQLSQGEGRGKRARTTSGTLVGDSTQPTVSTASGEAGPSNGAAPGGAQRSVRRPARAVRWKDENEVASILRDLSRTARGGPPDASDEAGPSKRARR